MSRISCHKLSQITVPKWYTYHGPSCCFPKGYAPTTRAHSGMKNAEKKRLKNITRLFFIFIFFSRFGSGWSRVIHKNARGKNQTRRPKFFGMEHQNQKTHWYWQRRVQWRQSSKWQGGCMSFRPFNIITWKVVVARVFGKRVLSIKQNFFDTVTSNKVFTHGCFIASSCLKLCILHKVIHRQCMAM